MSEQQAPMEAPEGWAEPKRQRPWQDVWFRRSMGLLVVGLVLLSLPLPDAVAPVRSGGTMPEIVRAQPPPLGARTETSGSQSPAAVGGRDADLVLHGAIAIDGAPESDEEIRRRLAAEERRRQAEEELRRLDEIRSRIEAQRRQLEDELLRLKGARSDPGPGNEPRDDRDRSASQGARMQSQATRTMEATSVRQQAPAANSAAATAPPTAAPASQVASSGSQTTWVQTVTAISGALATLLGAVGGVVTGVAALVSARHKKQEAQIAASSKKGRRR